MVAIVAGDGLGLLNTSSTVLGEAGVLGTSPLGPEGGRAYVNAATGNLVLQAQDQQLSGRGLDLFALRTHNSLGTPDDGDGDGWRWRYEQTVRFQGPGTPEQPQAGAVVRRTYGDGHETAFRWDAGRAAFLGTDGGGPVDELTYTGPGGWVLTDGSTGVVERYTDSTSPGMAGRMVRRTDRSGNSLLFTHDGGRLTLIRDAGSGQELRLEYEVLGGLTRVRRLETRTLVEDASGSPTDTLGPPVTQVTYDYDGRGRLTTVTTDLAPGAAFVTTYTYDGTTSRIARVHHADGRTVFFAYNEAGRLHTADALTFAYHPATGSTDITDGNGQVWTYRYDPATLQLTESRTPAVGGVPSSTTFAYDANGNPAAVTDARGHTVVYGYDGNGNCTVRRDALGNSVTRTYGALNQMLTETRHREADSDARTTRYAYDAAARPRFVVSAEGRVTENRYRDAGAGSGLPGQTLRYTGAFYDLTGMGPAQAPTEAQLAAWAAGIPDKTRVQLIEYDYDLRGNLSVQMAYATVDATGHGVLDDGAEVTEYRHDASSRLLRRTVVRGSARDQRTDVATAAYDGMGRVVTRTDAEGTRTTVYDDAAQRITVTGPSGGIEERVHDRRGRVTSVGRTGAAGMTGAGMTGDVTTRTTRYVYDGADRVRMAEDAQGGRRFRFYDAASRLEFTVDATGATTRLEYDATGQIVRHTQYRNLVDTSGWYDDTTGTVTKLVLTVGGAGSDVPVDDAHDRVDTSEYDAAGRLAQTTDTTGTVTSIHYDGASRVAMTQTGDRATRYLYDNDDERVGVVDPLGYLTEHRYDAGGRLAETVRYRDRSPAAANVSAPVWIGASTRTAVAGRPFRCRVPVCDADGDEVIVGAVGTLPGWLTFDARTATIRGIAPAAAGTRYEVRLRADDHRGNTSDVTVPIEVTGPPEPATVPGGGGPAWVSLPPLEAVTGTPLSYTLPPATGAAPGYRVVSGLPSGLSFDPGARTITGTPGGAGFSTVVFRATDAAGKSIDRTVSVRIRTATPAPDQPVGSGELAAWRSVGHGGLRSHFYYDGRGRVAGSVDERQFLTETVYDDAAGTRQTLRYLTPLVVGPDDTLASLRARAGAVHQTASVSYDGFDRVRTTIGPDGSTQTRNEYDRAGRLARVVTAAETAEQRARRTFGNAFGEVIATLGGEGDASLGPDPTPQQIVEAIRDYGTRIDVDTLGRPVRQVDANGNTTLFYYDRENRPSHTIAVLGHGDDGTLAGEATETTFTSFGEPASVRRYATRLAHADMVQLLAAGGGGGTASPALLTMLAALADPAADATASTEYDRGGRPVREVDGEGGVVRTVRNEHGEPVAQVRSLAEGRASTTQIDYDLTGRVVARTEDVGGINAGTLTGYDAFGRPIRQVDPMGNVTTTAYRHGGRTVVVTDPLASSTSTENDALGRVVFTEDALGLRTGYAYDEAARTVTVTTPESIGVTTARNRHDEPASVTDGRGGVIAYAYDRDGRPTTVTDALGRVVTRTAYARSGRAADVTDARGTVTRFGYDQRNRVVERRVDPGGSNLTTRYQFDALGRQITVTEGAGTGAARRTVTTYDRNDRVTRVLVDPAGLRLSTRYSFDDPGNTIKTERGTAGSPPLRVTLAEFDALARRVREVEAPSAIFGPGSPGTRDLTTRYLYDAAGRPACTIHPDGSQTWYVHDAAGRQIQTVDATGAVNESGYDATGLVVQTRRYLNRLSAGELAKLGDVVDAPVTPAPNPTRDRRCCYVHDGDGRLRFTLEANIATVWNIAEYRFDPNGNIVETRRYDKFLPESDLGGLGDGTSARISVADVEAELTALGYSDTDVALARTQRTRFAYDANDRLRFTVDGLGSVAETVYDPAGRPVSTVRYASRPVLTATSESAIDASVDRTDGGNQVTHYAYDATGRLRYTTAVLAGDASGKPTRHLVTEQAYDPLDRVVQTIAYATPVGPVADYTAATLAAAITAGDDDRRSAFVYDAAGREVYRVQVQTTGSRNIVGRRGYDALDRLVESTSYARAMALTDFGKASLDAATAAGGGPGDRTTRIVHDAAGRPRFAVDADGSVSETVYDARGRITESRRFDLLLGDSIAPTEEALSAWRGGRAVGDGVTRGTKHTYDAVDRLLTTTDAAGFTETTAYDALDDRTSFTDKTGATWRYEHDRQGRLFDEFSPPVPMQISNETAPAVRSLRTRLYHDALGNLVKRLDAAQTADQRLTEYAYDRLGRQILVVQPGWYDPATGRVEAHAAAGRFQRALATVHDALGNQIRTKLRTGAGSFQYEYKTYDRLGRVVHDVDASSNVTAFTYTAFGEQATLTRFGRNVGTPPGGADTPWTLAALDEALADDLLARTMTIRYDNLGCKTQTIQPTVAGYFFSDSFGHFIPLDSVVTPESAAGSSTFEYTAFRELYRHAVQLDATRAQETWHYYDPMGRETRTVVKCSDNIASENEPPRAGGFHSARGYDAFGNPTGVVEYAAVGEAGIGGDPITVPPAPEEAAADRITAYGYDVRDQQTGTVRFNLSYASVENGQVVQIDLGRDEGVPVQHIDYDAAGRVTASTDGLNNVTGSAYDALGRLVRVTEPARWVVRSGTGNPDPFPDGGLVRTSPVTDLVLNPFGQTVTSTRGSGHGDAAGETLIVGTTYDHAGNAVGTTDARGSVTTWQYDFSGRLLRTAQAINSTLGARFSAATQNLQVWRVVSHTLERRYAYDAVGHLTDSLDVFMDGSAPVQSGHRTIRNAFGEVTEEQLVWGAADDPPSALNHATRLRNRYDNAGNLVTREDAAGETRFLYNLAGRRTRAEQLGDDSTRIAETGYDLMGRTAWTGEPTFRCIEGLVTPVTELVLDRWGSVNGRTEVGALENGLAASIRGTAYQYDADGGEIFAELGFAPALRADGTSYTAIVTRRTSYDLAGRAVEQNDDARDTSGLPGSVPPSTLRTRITTYDGIGQVVEERDAEQLRQGQRGLRHAYDANGNRVATLTAVGNVFADTFDAGGNHIAREVLRLPPGGDDDVYVSGSGTVPMAVLLHRHGYDQAGRRDETRDYVSDSLFDAGFTEYDERGLVRGTFQLRETDGSLPYSEDPGRETGYAYDVLGNQIRQNDASGHIRTWNLDTAADSGDLPNLTVNRLISTTGTATTGEFDTTTYIYTDFGDVRQEDYTGTDIPDPTGQNNRACEYEHNGLVARTTDRQTVGTPGPTGGLDYWSSISTNKYTYTDRRLTVTADIDTTGFYEDFAPFGGGIQSEPAQPERRTIGTSYDERDRPVTVINSCFGIDGVSKRSSAEVTYDYDELGNRTRVTFNSVARSTMPGGATITGEIIHGRQEWFDYDREGRITLAGRTVEQDGTVTNTGVVLTYDAAGRRATSLTRQGTEYRGYTDPDTGVHTDTESWEQSRLERYTYNDLGYLVRIDQAGVRSGKLNLVTDDPIPDDPGPSPFLPSETRTYDLLGRLQQSNQYSEFRFISAYDMTMEEQTLQVTVTNQYTAAGLLDSQTSIHPGNSLADADTSNVYDEQGLLQSYTYTKGDGLGTDTVHGFRNTYTYSRAFKAGLLREQGIDVVSNLKDSTATHLRNTYDGRGNLVWQRSMDGPGNTEMVFFDYDGSGRVLDKAELELPPARQTILGDTYNSFFYDSSGEAVGNVPSSSFSATSAGLHANFALGFTPVSATYPGPQPGSYAVVAGDTLAGIAKSFIGDAQAWYLIAEANGLTAGPDEPLVSQVGRVLHIPNVVTNVRNNAATNSPYNANTIIANTPWVGAPMPPPGPSPWQQGVDQLAPFVGTVTSMVLAVTLSELGPLGVGIAAVAGDLANQAVQIGLGSKELKDYNVVETGEAGLIGTAAGGLSALGSAAARGGGLAAQALAQAGSAAAGYAVTTGIREAFHGDAAAPLSGWTLLATGGGAAVTPVLGGFFSRLARAALNPETGWVWHPDARAWDSFYQTIAMGLGQVVIQDSFGSPRHDPPPARQASRPAPPAVLEDSAEARADLAWEYRGSEEVAGVKNYVQTLLDDLEKPGIHTFLDTAGRIEQQYELDADGRVLWFTDANGVTTIPEVIVVEPPAPAYGAVALTNAPQGPDVGPYATTGGDHVHQVASRTRNVGDKRETAPQYEEANAISTRDPRLYNDPAAQKTEAAINRAAWGRNYEDFYPAGQEGVKVKTTIDGVTTESVVSITTSGATSVGVTGYPAISPYFEDVKSYYKLREGGLAPDQALAEVFNSALQLENAGVTGPSRVPNTPPNFRAAPAPPNAGTSSLPTVFRRTPTGIEPVKTFTPEPGPGKVVMYSAAPGGPLVLDPAPTLRGSVGGIVVQVAPHAVERGVEWMGFDHTDARRAGFVTSVLATARLGASMGAVDEGIGAVPGAIIGAVIGALAYGFEGLTGHYGPRSNPVFNIIVDPDNPYPTGPQWGDPTTGY